MERQRDEDRQDWTGRGRIGQEENITGKKREGLDKAGQDRTI